MADLIYNDIASQIAGLIDKIGQGYINELDAYAELKELQKLLNSAIANVEPLAMDAAMFYADKKFEHNGYTFEKRNGGTRYSYKNIKEWQLLNNEIKQVEEMAKQAYIARQKGILTANEDGEEIEMPEVTYTKDSLIIKKNE